MKMKQLGCWRKRNPHSGSRGQRAAPLRQKRSWSSRLLGSGWALLLILIGGLVSFIAAPPASAQQAGTLIVSPTSGPVGTLVHLSGTLGPGCTSQGTGVTFENPSPYGPEEGVTPAARSNGSWLATFVIPPYVGGAATRRAGNLTVGTWDFAIPVSCSPPGRLLSVPFFVTSVTPSPSRFVGMTSSPNGRGYWLAQAGGGVFAFGDAGFYGSLPGLGVTPAAPVVGIASTPDGKGYWLVGADGGVFAFGDASFYGSLPGDHISPYGVIVGIASTPDGKGYWLVGADGGVFAFGDAGFYGTDLNGFQGGATALLPTHDGGGYVVTFAEGAGRVASYGDAPSFGTAGVALPTLLVGGTITSDNGGVWEVGTDGGVFAFGDAGFYGSLPGLGVTPAAPVVGIASTPDGKGYWLVGADGGVFAFGDAGFYGSAA